MTSEQLDYCDQLEIDADREWDLWKDDQRGNLDYGLFISRKEEQTKTIRNSNQIHVHNFADS